VGAAIVGTGATRVVCVATLPRVDGAVTTTRELAIGATTVCCCFTSAPITFLAIVYSFITANGGLSEIAQRCCFQAHVTQRYAGTNDWSQ